MVHADWIIGQAAPPPQLPTNEFFHELGRLVDKVEALQALGSHLLSTYGVPNVGMLKEMITTTNMRDSLQECGLNESYATTIGTFLTADGDDAHKFKNPLKRKSGFLCTLPAQGGTKEKKMCTDRDTLTAELGGRAGVDKMMDLLEKTLAAWCTVPPKRNRLDQPEVNTITACYMGVVMRHSKGNMYTDIDFLSASKTFLEKHWPLLNVRAGKAERSW